MLRAKSPFSSVKLKLQADIMASIELNYRQSMPFFISLICLIFSQIIFSPCYRLQANDSFYVSDIRIDVKDHSSAQARLKAIAQGQLKAFEVLTERLLSSKDQSSLAQPSENQLNTMIQNFEVLHEKNSATRYIGIFAFQFHPKKVQDFLKQSGKTILPADINEKILVLPIFKSEEDKKIILWQDNNPWRHAWNQGIDATSPYSLPLGDLEDILEFPEQTALNRDFGRLQSLRQRYHTGYVLVAVLKQGCPFELALFLYNDQGLRLSEDNISLLGETTLTPKLMNSARHKVMTIVDNTLSEDKIDQQHNRQDVLELQISFCNHQEWLKIQKIISTAALIRSFDVVSLQKRRAVVQLHSVAADRRIFQTLEKKGLKVMTLNQGLASEKIELCLDSMEQQNHLNHQQHSYEAYDHRQQRPYEPHDQAPKQRPHTARSSKASSEKDDRISFHDEIKESQENFYEILERPS